MRMLRRPDDQLNDGGPSITPKSPTGVSGPSFRAATGEIIRFLDAPRMARAETMRANAPRTVTLMRNGAVGLMRSKDIGYPAAAGNR